MDNTEDIQPHRSIMRTILGPPLETAAAPHQAISKPVGLAVFASDALSSTAYATEEILVVLALAGSAYFGLSIPIALAIVGLLVVLTISYRQTIHAYPNGGGAYIVARDNLGEGVAQVAAAALLMDYVLTVAVSISSGVAQIVSAFPAVAPFRVGVALALLALMAVINLRGVKESGRTFAVPTYIFLAGILLTIIVGLFRWATGTLQTLTDVESIVHTTLEPLTLFLILRAFSSGSTALTGVEAISNGIPAFEKPQTKNAAATLTWMSIILADYLPGGDVPGASNWRAPFRVRDCDLPAWKSGLRPGDRTGGLAGSHDADPDYGRQHQLCGLSPAGFPGGRGRLSPPPVNLPRLPAGLLLGDCCIERAGRVAAGPVPGQYNPLNPALCHRGLFKFFTLSDRNGHPLAKNWPPAAR